MDQSVAMADAREKADGRERDLRRVAISPDYWHPVAWSRELKTGKPLAVSFAGQPIVLARPRTGPVFALEDRCAHRQVPLSDGVIDGQGIRCGYHGWTYDCAGACTDVPYLGRSADGVRLPNGVRSYPVVEKDGLVLVFPGDSARAQHAALPMLGSVANPAYKTRRFGHEVGCHYSFMHENLMDMNHQFLHRRLMGQIRPRFVGQDAGDGWVEAKYTFARMGGKQPLGEALVFGQRRGNGNATGDRDVMTIRTEYPYQTLRIVTDSAVPVMDLWITHTPLDREQRRVRTFGLLSVHKPKIPGLLDALWPLLIVFTERIFKEDRDIVEQEQAAHDAQGGDWNQEVFPVIRKLRTLLRNSGVSEPLAMAAE